MTQFRPSGFSILPEVVKNLLIINGLMFLATLVLAHSTLGINLVEKLSLFYFGSEHFRPYQYVTYLFMHSPDNFFHLLLNMFALWMFGAVLENVWGPKRFLFYYLITGLGAAFIHTAYTYYDISSFEHTVAQYAEAPTIEGFKEITEDNVPKDYIPYQSKKTSYHLLLQWSHEGDNDDIKSESVNFLNRFAAAKKNSATLGASGAVFGVLLAFGMLFPNTYIMLYLFFPIKAKYFVILYGLFELWSGLRNNPTDNIAHFAHLGGMIFGYFLIKHWNKRNRIDFY